MGRMTFERYVRDVLGGEPYIPVPDDFEDQTFITALASFTALSAGTQGMVNARGEKLQFDYGYVKSMKPNAFCAVHEGVHVIGFNQALLVTIVDFALFVFTQADQFPELGDAAGEDSPDPTFGAAPGIFLLERTMRGDPVTAQNHSHRVPKDVHRHVAAIYLAMMMVRFAWLHELSHCVNGHVLLLNNMMLGLALNEVPDAATLVQLKGSGEKAETARRRMHAYELDADETALRTLCRIQLLGGENIEGIAALDLGTRMEMNLLGVHLMTWLFEEYQRFTNALHDRTHPFPRDRLSNLMRFARDEIGPAIEGFEPLHDKACASFNRLASKIPNMYHADPGASSYSPLRGDPDLAARLAPLQFRPVMR